MTNKISPTPEAKIHRCYMTGQKCVYLRELLRSSPEGAFLLSPFMGDFNHIWHHHISKLDLQKIEVDGEVKRADSVARTGYVMCSRICYPIQSAAVVIADVTFPNLNVFYELGLACALGKRLALMAHTSKCTEDIRSFLNSAGLLNHLHNYTAGSDDFQEKILASAQPVKQFRDSLSSSSNEHYRIPIFSHPASESSHEIWSPEDKIYDLVAKVLNILGKKGSLNRILERSRFLLSERGDTHGGSNLNENTVSEHLKKLAQALYRQSAVESRISRAQAIGMADCVIMDISARDFETYFWLGICHGLEKDVVPLSIEDDAESDEPLPFDIRTLWHVGGTWQDSTNIEQQLHEIIIEIVSHTIALNANRHRDSFWHPIIHSHKLSFFLGSEQSSQLASKQVVGEWDLRTFQEIASFASRMNPNLDVEIKKPAFRRNEYSKKDRSGFEELLTDRMSDTHCVVLGTPDVNPVAEMILSKLKKVKPFVAWTPGSSTKENIKREFDDGEVEGYIPFKNYLSDYLTMRPSSFFTQFDEEYPERGFLYFGGDGSYLGNYSEWYPPREIFEASAKGESLDKWNHKGLTKSAMRNINGDKLLEWKLVGHLVIAPNPFAKNYPDTRLRVLLLMGVGGPATLGLAHLLTGIPPESVLLPWSPDEIADFTNHSEKCLDDINNCFMKGKATEIITEVTVVNSLMSKNSEYEDSREIRNIQIASSLQGIDNPKPFHLAID